MDEEKLAETRGEVIAEVLQIIRYARDEGEIELRQIRDWISDLTNMSAAALLKELKED